MNLNINMRVDKAMRTIAESKTLRKWTYIVSVLFILGMLILQSGNILTGLADLIRAFNGR